MIMSKEPAVLRQHAHLQILHGVPIFSHLEPSELMDLYRRTTVKRWYGGAIILGQDEPGRALYILVKGRARVVLFGENGREMTLSTLSPGDFFGEMALLDSKPHSANVLASEDVVLLVLGREAFLEHLHVHPRSALTLLEQMSLRLRRANETISNLALHDVSSRLIRTLLLLAEESGEDRDGGILIRRRPTQQELANMVGTCRETVSRTLSAMARKGLVVSRGRSLFLSPALLHGMQEAA